MVSIEVENQTRDPHVHAKTIDHLRTITDR